LPKAKSNETTNKDHVSVSVTEAGVYYINKEAVPFDQLETVLLQKTAAAHDNVVLLRVPADNKVQDLVDLMQIGVKLKLNFVIATSK